MHHGGYKILRSFDRGCITCFDIADYTLYGGTNEGDIIVCSLIYDEKYKFKIKADFKVTPPCDTKLNVAITSIAISPCKKYLSIGNCNGVVVVFSIIKKDLLHILYSYDDHKGGISVLKWSRFESHKLFSGGTDGLVVELNCCCLLESNDSDSTDIINQYFKSFISFVGIKSKVLTTVCHCSSAIHFIDCETIHRDDYIFDAVLVCCHHDVYIFHLPIQPLQEQPKFCRIDSCVFQLGCGYFCECINDTSHHNETVTGIITFKSADKLLMPLNEYTVYNNHVIVHLYTIDGNFQEEVLLTKLGHIQSKEISIRSIHGFVDTSLYTSRILICVSESRDMLYVNLVERTIEAVEFSNADYFSNRIISVRTDSDNIFILHEYPSSHNTVTDDVVLIGIDILSIANIGFNHNKLNKPIMIYSYNTYFHIFVKLQKRWTRYYHNIKLQKLSYTSSYLNQDLTSALDNSKKKNEQKNILHRLPDILEEVEVLSYSPDSNSPLMHDIYCNEKNSIDKSIGNFTDTEANKIDWRAISDCNDLTDRHHSTYIWLKDTAGTWAEKWNDNQENGLKSKLFSRRSVEKSIAECENKCLVSFENDMDFNFSRKINRQYSVTLDTANGIGLILSICRSDDVSTIVFVKGFHNLSNGNPRYYILFLFTIFFQNDIYSLLVQRKNLV